MTQLRIGIPLIQQELNGSTGWVAGLYFIKNSLKALMTLDESQVPEIIVFTTESFNDNLTDSEKTPSWLKIVRFKSIEASDILGLEALEQAINSYHCDLFFPLISTPSFHINTRSIGWITDYQEKHLPQFFSADELKYRQLFAEFILSFSNKTICISQDVLKDLKTFFPRHSDKGRVIYFRSTLADQNFKLDPQNTVTEFGINRKYIYLPNQFWIHKNHRLVFEAWKMLKDKGHDYLLVCTGFKADYRKEGYYQEIEDYLEKNDLKNNILLLGFVDRDKQIQLYRGASAILQPSLFEGWNTSIEDAKHLGKKIILSDLAIHHEQCGNDAFFFNPHDVHALANTIEAKWSLLPDGLDLLAENHARQLYATLIKNFGQSLIELFREVANEAVENTNDKNQILALLLFYQRHLRATEKVLHEQDALLSSQRKVKYSPLRSLLRLGLLPLRLIKRRLTAMLAKT